MQEKEQLNELALFAGVGGGLLGSKFILGHKVIGYVEREPYCTGIIEDRIRDGILDDAPIWDDARTFDGNPWSGLVDVISAGFPCQPFSVAGKHRGEDDERNLWPDTIRIIRQVRPRYAFLENVPGLLARHGYFGRILGDLAEGGYDAEWTVLSAAHVGANHIRRRLWILAHAIDQRRPERWAEDDGRDTRRGGGRETDPEVSPEAPKFREDVADPDKSGLSEWKVDQDHERTLRDARPSADAGGWWATEPDVGRVADGVADRMDRIRAIGNGQVPIVAATAFRLLARRAAKAIAG